MPQQGAAKVTFSRQVSGWHHSPAATEALSAPATLGEGRLNSDPVHGASALCTGESACVTSDFGHEATFAEPSVAPDLEVSRSRQPSKASDCHRRAAGARRNNQKLVNAIPHVSPIGVFLAFLCL